MEKIIFKIMYIGETSVYEYLFETYESFEEWREWDDSDSFIIELKINSKSITGAFTPLILDFKYGLKNLLNSNLFKSIYNWETDFITEVEKIDSEFSIFSIDSRHGVLEKKINKKYLITQYVFCAYDFFNFLILFKEGKHEAFEKGVLEMIELCEKVINKFELKSEEYEGENPLDNKEICEKFELNNLTNQ